MTVSALDMQGEIQRLQSIATSYQALLVKHNALLQAAGPVADALDHYGQHSAMCAAGHWPYSGICDCGLVKALAQAVVVQGLRGQT